MLFLLSDTDLPTHIISRTLRDGIVPSREQGNTQSKSPSRSFCIDHHAGGYACRIHAEVSQVALHISRQHVPFSSRRRTRSYDKIAIGCGKMQARRKAGSPYRVAILQHCQFFPSQEVLHRRTFEPQAKAVSVHATTVRTRAFLGSEVNSIVAMCTEGDQDGHLIIEI
jgi:hypothetical protein